MTSGLVAICCIFLSTSISQINGNWMINPFRARNTNYIEQPIQPDPWYRSKASSNNAGTWYLSPDRRYRVINLKTTTLPPPTPMKTVVPTARLVCGPTTYQVRLDTVGRLFCCGNVMYDSDVEECIGSGLVRRKIDDARKAVIFQILYNLLDPMERAKLGLRQ